MAGVTFTHPHPQIGRLSLRLPPTEVSWQFKLNTSVQDTSIGQVIQVLSISYDQFYIQGQFGKEGPHGRRRLRNRMRERRPDNYFALDARGPTAQQPYLVGLTQMTAYFRRYFTLATQGGDLQNPGGRYLRGNYNQQPMTLTYRGGQDDYERNWLIYPTSFPSYKRSNADFAPEWRVEAQVVEPDWRIDKDKTNEAIERLRKGVGYRALNPFSDPLAVEITGKKGKRKLVKLTERQLDVLNTRVFDYYSSLLPAYSAQDLAELINVEASLPNIYAKELAKLGVNAPTPAQLEEFERKQKKKKRQRQRQTRGPEGIPEVFDSLDLIFPGWEERD